jgi:hypothetical protein
METPVTWMAEQYETGGRISMHYLSIILAGAAPHRPAPDPIRLRVLDALVTRPDHPQAVALVHLIIGDASRPTAPQNWRALVRDKLEAFQRLPGVGDDARYTAAAGVNRLRQH